MEKTRGGGGGCKILNLFRVTDPPRPGTRCSILRRGGGGGVGFASASSSTVRKTGKNIPIENSLGKKQQGNQAIKKIIWGKVTKKGAYQNS